MISKDEIQTAKEISALFLYYKDTLPYANINNRNKYLGWCSNFNLYDGSNQRISLDLNCENDIFLLFVLAIFWSRSGPWENAAYFISYLKLNKKDHVDYWLDDSNICYEKESRFLSAAKICTELSGIITRKKVSFREDIFDSLYLLATNWKKIKSNLKLSEEMNDYTIFMNHLHSIYGLGSGKNRY